MKDIDFCPLVLGAFTRIEYMIIEGMKREDNVEESKRKYITDAPHNLNG